MESGELVESPAPFVQASHMDFNFPEKKARPVEFGGLWLALGFVVHLMSSPGPRLKPQISYIYIYTIHTTYTLHMYIYIYICIHIYIYI